MTVRQDLADRLVDALAEHGPCSGRQLALAVGVRKQVVLAELRDARRFERAGRGPTSVWRSTGTDQEPLCRVATPARDYDITPDVRDLLASILMRLDVLERMLAPEPSAIAKADAPLVGQLDVYDAIAVNGNGEAPES